MSLSKQQVRKLIFAGVGTQPAVRVEQQVDLMDHFLDRGVALCKLNDTSLNAPYMSYAVASAL